MKKSLLFITAIFFIVALWGQAGDPILMKVPKNITCKAVRGTQMIPFQKTSQVVPKVYESYPDVIGETYLPVVSNASARNTASLHPNGDMACVWTYYNYLQEISGTGYNASHGDIMPYWDIMPDERLENVEGNAGWPTHVYTIDGEVVISHGNAIKSLIVLTREQRGEGKWNQEEIFEEEYPNGLWWPTACASGNTVHLVAMYDCEYGTGVINPVYYRSQDGGKTWDIRAYTFPEIPQTEKDGMFADNYTITSKGNHVVFAYVMTDNSNYVGHCGNVGYVESLDGGNTWTYKKVYDCNFENDNPALIARGVAAAIDANNAVHIAFNAILVDNLYQYTFDGGIFYWKSTQEVLTQDSFGIEYEKTGEEYNITKLGYLKYQNFIYHPELLGYDYWTLWPGASSEMVIGYNNQGTVYNPRMVVEDGKVYLLYGSIIEQPMIYQKNDEKYFYRGIFLTVSDDNGDTFDQLRRTSWISYNNVLFSIDWCDYTGPVGTPGEFEITTIKSIWYTENGWPTMAKNSSEKGELLFQWLYTHTYPMGLEEGDPYLILTQVIPKNWAGLYMNTREIMYSFIPVTEIVDLPETATVNIPLKLIGTVIPHCATMQFIHWNVSNAGSTGAIITDYNYLHTTASGTAVITATISFGGEGGTHYTQDFCVEVSPLGVAELAGEGFSVWPNPTTGELRITNYELRIDNVEVYDIYGRNVIPHTSHRLPHTTIDISHLQSGIYFVKIITEQGEVVKKVVKQ